jgi:uncharacterized membrane protein SpoIIM required for sporulation/ABC-type transport system involved in multi-copper enzyme maturation permease subunit
MLADLRPALIITRREVRDQFRDWRIMAPMLVLTVVFPGLMNFTAHQMVGFVQRYGASLVADRLIPFLLMIVGFFPISVSLVIALESFVGEKERHSIEPLLSSPLTDRQLYLGKLLAAMVPPLLASYLGIGVYLVGIYRQVGWTPGWVLLVQVLALTTVQALVMVSGAVVVSAQTTSIRAANLLASFIIIPMTFLIQGESMVMFWANYSVLWLAIGGQIVIAGLLVRAGLSQFNREELLGRELDSLNMRWAWRAFWWSFRNQAPSLLAWYQQEIPQTLGRLRAPLVLVTLCLILSALLGAQFASQYPLPPQLLTLNDVQSGLTKGLGSIRFFTFASIPVVWLHNMRVLALAVMLGIFSFGVLALIVLMAPLALIGYFTGVAAGVGLSPWVFLTALVLPHGILEVPAIILAGAAILRLGATLAAPPQGRTIGEAWLSALADWVKIMLALVLPLLLGAAALEVFITPRVAAWLLGG